MTAEKILEDNKSGVSYTEREILEEIEIIKMRLEKTKMNFDMSTDEILIDSYIYEIISLNKKYQYFLRLAKKYGVSATNIKTRGKNRFKNK